MAKNDVYQIITDRIIEKLESGVIPWKKPWTPGRAPQNMVSKRAYHGCNLWLLDSTRFKSPFYLSFKQVSALGGKVKAGERGQIVIYWLIRENEETKEKRFFPFYYTVFNFEQTEGLTSPAEKQAREVNKIEEAEKLIAGYKDAPKIIERPQDEAFYRPSSDEVIMPERKQFKTDDNFYYTLFHELTHSTGHKKRLDRFGGAGSHNFGGIDYSKEELTAEMGAAFMAGITGIQPQIEASAAYIQNWLQVLKNDKRFIISASSKAQKAVDYITGKEIKAE